MKKIFSGSYYGAFPSSVDYHGVDVALFRSAKVHFYNTERNTSNSPVQFCPFPVYPG